MVNLLFTIILCVLLVPFSYFVVLAVGAAKKAPGWKHLKVKRNRKFVVAVAAHNEAAVIEHSIRKLRALDYPSDRFIVVVVADHCTDDTANLAARAGAIVYQRDSGPRSGKGAALSWLFNEIWNSHLEVDAVVIFDADTVVDRRFLRVMNAHLENGDRVIQGQHIIANPRAGWFPLLTWAMFIIDNRFQNQGRANLGWSAKHMGDSICFRADVLKQMSFGTGLTEDYELRQKLLLAGIRIAYEPAAKGYGEAPRTWTSAGRQRSRWMRGVSDANKNFARALLQRGFKLGSGAMIDGALQCFLPSFSTVTLATMVFLVIAVVLKVVSSECISQWVIMGLALVVVSLFFYPFWGLALEHAPLKAYLVMTTGPVFILWRCWLALKSRYLVKQVHWIRTPHGV